jgi:hypothetical protein
MDKTVASLQKRTRHHKQTQKYHVCLIFALTQVSERWQQKKHLLKKFVQYAVFPLS